MIDEDFLNEELLSSGPIEITFPYPPSVNTIYRHVGKFVKISREGREYFDKTKRIIEDLDLKLNINFEVSVEILAFPVDKRRRDVDNILKAIFDSLEKGELLNNDSLIKKLTVERKDKDKENPRVEIIVRKYEDKLAST